jgi:hypothetical protein
VKYHEIASRRFRRHLLRNGALSVAYLAAPSCLTVYARKMTPMMKRDPTAAERQAVYDYHTKGYLKIA